MTKLKNVSWATLPRQSKLAAVLYPQLVPPEIQREMVEISRAEGKRSPLDRSSVGGYANQPKKRR
jgi:hypothetical protein